MFSNVLALPLAIALAIAAPAAAGAKAPDASDTWLAAGEKMAGEAKKAEAARAAEAEAPPGDGPPLPLHTIEGVGGTLMVPMAYLVNRGPEGTVIGKPAVSFTYLNIGSKSLQAFVVTETLWRRFEFGYALNRLDLGSLPHRVRTLTGGALRIRRQEVYLHHFNVRALLVEENSFDLPLPALTAGVHVKVNGGIRGIDDSTGGAFTAIGLDRSNGIDFTLTASKMFPQLMFGRPLILSAGLRNSQASHFGLTGFGDSCATTFEAHACCLITDWLGLAYEFRGRTNPYDKVDRLFGDETNGHAICLALILDEHVTVAGGWAYLGPVGNTQADCAWGIQLKYEF